MCHAAGLVGLQPSEAQVVAVETICRTAGLIGLPLSGCLQRCVVAVWDTPGVDLRQRLKPPAGRGAYRRLFRRFTVKLRYFGKIFDTSTKSSTLRHKTSMPWLKTSALRLFIDDAWQFLMASPRCLRWGYYLLFCLPLTTGWFVRSGRCLLLTTGWFVRSGHKPTSRE